MNLDIIFKEMNFSKKYIATDTHYSFKQAAFTFYVSTFKWGDEGDKFRQFVEFQLNLPLSTFKRNGYNKQLFLIGKATPIRFSLEFKVFHWKGYNSFA